MKTERFDTSPLDLEIGLQVVMRNPKSNLWDIKGTVVSIRQGGRSCYVKTDSSNRTYLRNRRLLRVDKTQQVTETECFVISWRELPKAISSCLRRAAKPWQVKKPDYKSAGGKKRRVVFNSTKDQVFIY